MALELPHPALQLAARFDQLDGESSTAHIDAEIVHEAAHRPEARQRRSRQLPLVRSHAPWRDDAEVRQLDERIEREIAEAEEHLDLDPVVLAEQVSLSELDAFDHADSSSSALGCRHRASSPLRGLNARSRLICSYNARAAGEFAGGTTTLSTTY